MRQSRTSGSVGAPGGQLPGATRLNHLRRTCPRLFPPPHDAPHAPSLGPHATHALFDSRRLLGTGTVTAVVHGTGGKPSELPTSDDPGHCIEKSKVAP